MVVNNPTGSTNYFVSSIVSTSLTGPTGIMTVAGHIVPSSNSAYNLGLSNTQWQTIFVRNINLGSTILAPTGTTDLTISSSIVLGYPSNPIRLDVSGNSIIQKNPTQPTLTNYGSITIPAIIGGAGGFQTVTVSHALVRSSAAVILLTYATQPTANFPYDPYLWLGNVTTGSFTVGSNNNTNSIVVNYFIPYYG